MGMSTAKPTHTLEEVTILFAGDSGDGMQLTGSQFSDTSAIFGNDISTLPDFPAEIRAPQGTLYGVSSFQLRFGSGEVSTPGDRCNVLVVMNPAALKSNLVRLEPGGVIIANTGGFTAKNLRLAGFDSDPLEDDSLHDYRVFDVDISDMTSRALADLQLSSKEVERCKNFFALGMMYWLYDRPLKPTIEWAEKKFARKPDIREANIAALQAGWNYGETAEIFTARYEVKPASPEAGLYRSVTGNAALSYGLLAAAQSSGLEMFFGSYPITPASDILHYISGVKNFGIKVFQGEDEIAAICAAIGAAFGGSLAVTTTSGPGLALKTEATGLAIMTELPLIIVDVQRAGPSTGMPTKVEQSDLMQALYGRNGEAPLPVLAPATPADCFHMAFEAARIALKYMTPVILLSDAYLANGSQPWKIPDVSTLPSIDVEFSTDAGTYQPYHRNPTTLARDWAVPGTPGLEHRIGGLESQDGTGAVSYDPHNHEHMVRTRQAKIDNIANDIPPACEECSEDGEVLVIGWGSTYGAIRTAVEKCRAEGLRVAHVHLRYLNPFPTGLEDLVKRYKRVLVPELNNAQLVHILRARFLIDCIPFDKIQGQPFHSAEIELKIRSVIEEVVL